MQDIPELDYSTGLGMWTLLVLELWLEERRVVELLSIGVESDLMESMRKL